MAKMIPLLTVTLLVAAGAAWAQNSGSAVAPVTTPQSTGATVQGTSGMATTATQGTPAPSKDEKKDEKKAEPTAPRK